MFWSISRACDARLVEEKDGPRAGDIDDLMYMLFGFGGVLRKRQGQLEDRGWQKAQMSAEELADRGGPTMALDSNIAAHG